MHLFVYVVAVPDVFSVAKDAVADVKASAVRGRRVRRRRSAVATRSHGRRRVHGQKRRRRVRRRRCGGVPKPCPRQPPRLPRAHQNQTMQSPRPKQAGFRLGRQQHRRFRRTHLRFRIRDAHAAASVAPEAVFDRVVGPDEVPAVAEGAGGAIPAPGPGRSAAGMASPPSMAPSPAVTGCGIAPPPIGFRTSRATAAANEAEMVPTAR